MTDETGELAAALAAFQAEMPVVPKTHTAKVKTEKGGYEYTYADLADVSAAAMPLLAKHGLAFTCLPEAGLLRGILMHSSGAALEGVLPIEGRSPQALGGALTYMRRYLLGCLTGIVTDDDDDGHLASRPAPPPVAAPRPAVEPGYDAATGRPTLPADAPITRETRETMDELFTVLGIDDEVAQITGAGKSAGRMVDNLDALTESEGRLVVDRLRQRQREAPAPIDPAYPAAGNVVDMPNQDRGRPSSRAQHRMILAAFGNLAKASGLGDLDRDERLKLCGRIIARDVESTTNLTSREASMVIDTLGKVQSLEALYELLDGLDEDKR